jgi:hypothetical protein
MRSPAAVKKSSALVHKLEKDFFLISKEIVLQNKTIREWAEIESDDMFQIGNYEGGFDNTEMAFCFKVKSTISNIGFN